MPRNGLAPFLLSIFVLVCTYVTLLPTMLSVKVGFRGSDPRLESGARADCWRCRFEMVVATAFPDIIHELGIRGNVL